MTITSPAIGSWVSAGPAGIANGQLVASVGQSFELGNVVVSLDGSGPNSNGHIDSFDDYNVVSQCGGTNVNAQGAIDFEAAVGPLALEIEDARVLLDIDVQVNLATPATDGHVTITNILSTTRLSRITWSD